LKKSRGGEAKNHGGDCDLFRGAVKLEKKREGCGLGKKGRQVWGEKSADTTPTRKGGGDGGEKRCPQNFEKRKKQRENR